MTKTLTEVTTQEESVPEYVEDAVTSGNPWKSEEALRYLFSELGLRQKQISELYDAGVPAIWQARQDFGILIGTRGRPSNKEVRTREAIADGEQTGLCEWA